MKLLIVGDISPKFGLKEKILNKEYSELFDDVKQVISNSDYSICNLECPIIEESYNPITKIGPNLHSHPNVIEAIKYAGFRAVTLANNHFRDYGNEGCNNTISLLEKNAIDYVGGGKDIANAKKPIYIKSGDITIAIVNFCEHEFSIATANRAGAAPIDCVDNYNTIKFAKTTADFVVVIIHGGHEHYQLPSPRMQKYYRWLIDIGADTVVNHHQHCCSGFEVYKNAPIVYGLGNFLFDRLNVKDKPWNYGYMAILNITKGNSISLDVVPYEQCNGDYSVRLLNNDRLLKFEKDIDALNCIIRNEVALETNFRNFAKNKAIYKESSILPYTNRYLNYAARKKWIPSFLSKKKIIEILNNVECESHRDLFIYYLQDKIN